MAADVIHPSGYDHDVFISYSRKDQPFVEWLSRALEDAQLRYFRDTTDLQIFDKIDATLKRHIGRSRWLVAVISPNYLSSYWCLFEAMEALQGQDREQRLVPLVLRYRPDDQSFNEDFVLGALADLEQQIQSFERRMVTARAYELGGKLSKLNFVRANLPVIFKHIQDRIYPQFEMWNAAACTESGRQFLQWLRHDLPSDFDPPEFDCVISPVSLQARVGEDAGTPRLSTMPVVLWKAHVGYCAWKNTPVAVGDDVFVGTCGERWNETDPLDGVRCLDAESGKEKWFAHTPADANQVLVTKGLVVTGCDDGSVAAWDARTGVKEWRRTLESGIVGGPIRIPARTMAQHSRASPETIEAVFVVTYLGALHILNVRNGEDLQRRELGCHIIASPQVDIDPRWGPMASIFDTRGGVHLVEFDEGRITDVRSLTIYTDESPAYEQPKNHPAADGFSPQLSVGANDRVVLASYVRSTYRNFPPLVAINLHPHRLAWRASNPNSIGDEDFGNLRSFPVMVDGEIILATAYSNQLVGLSRETGIVTWGVKLGSEMFEQWSGPVADGSAVYLGRHDGYLHRVNARLRRREWSLYLGEQTRAGYAIAGDQTTPEFGDLASSSSAGSAPILATPALDRGRIYVGTAEGWLYCIGNLGM
jgi:outer membrane protein assembly factor BamB